MRLPIPSVLLALIVAAGACSSSFPVEPPPPPVEPAPKETARLAVHVHQLVDPRETPEDEWEYHHMSGWTTQLRASFQSALQAAGYTVIVDRHTPCDLVATVQAAWPTDQPGVATLVLTDRGDIVERLSVPIRLLGTPPETTYLKDEAAVALVGAMNRSAKVARFAHDVDEHRTPKIAAPAESAPAAGP